jgi:hypothetical protein
MRTTLDISGDVDFDVRSCEALPLFERLAARYVWWQSLREAALQPRRIITRVMELGDYADVEALGDAVGEAALRAAFPWLAGLEHQ